MPCLFLNTERGFGGKPPQKSGFRRHLAGSKMPKETFFHGDLPLESGLAARARCLGFWAGVAAVSRPRSSATATMQLYFRRSGSSRDTVLQNQVERAASERLAADEATRSARPRSAVDPSGFELVLQKPDRAEFRIAAKDRAYNFRLAVDDDGLAVLRPIPERRHAAHPHPLLLRGGDLVADALAHDLALELRKEQQNIQGQAPHRARCVHVPVASTSLPS